MPPDSNVIMGLDFNQRLFEDLQLEDNSTKQVWNADLILNGGSSCNSTTGSFLRNGVLVAEDAKERKYHVM